MSTALETYFVERLKSSLPLEGIGRLAAIPASSMEGTPIADTGPGREPGRAMKYPVVFEDKHFGWLLAERLTRGPLSSSSQAALESLALQMALLWKASNTEAAIELDRFVEKLKGTNISYDWCGIYLLKEENLHLTAFRGAPTPHIVIKKSKGICGAAVMENQSLNIADVSVDPRYLSCDSRTKSELVVPIRNEAGEAIAEIDIDSHTLSAFDAAAVQKMEELAREVSALVLKLG